MNVAIIFAGGTGKRMNTKARPKQFLELHGKPILIYTLEVFQKHEQINSIIIVMLEKWISYTEDLVNRYGLNKVRAIVSGGESGQQSIYMGLLKAADLFNKESVVLIHDGVRPLVDEETISKAIECVKINGTAITVAPAIETIVLKSNVGEVGRIIDRSKCQMAKAPQCFILKEILEAHHKAQQEGKNEFIDSACLMQNYGHVLHTIEGTYENIKITTPGDFYIFRAIIDARENSQIFGI